MATTTSQSRARGTRSTNRSRSTPAPAPPEPSTASKLRAPLIAGGAAIAGIAGGIILGAKARPRRRKLPSVAGLDGKKTRKQVASVSKGFGTFTRELRKAGEQAERIGNALD
jgi:hypothetical protein